LLRSGGVSAVKIHGLRRQTGLTTGSFYHHFDGMSDYLEELAGFWGRDTPDHLREAQDPDPRLRLRKLASIVPREGLLNLDMAMRDWAGSDRAAAAAVERVDESLLGFVAEAFGDLGFDTAESQVRAHAWIAFGVARIRPPWPVDGEVVDRFIDLLCNPR
ncbi:MAG: TetR/AcrR family transcriptional regulator, partial [Actinomycetota bacterium]